MKGLESGFEEKNGKDEKVSVRDFTHYSSEELGAFIPVLESEAWGDILLMCLYTSMDVAQVLSITADSVDYEKKTITSRVICMEKGKYISVKMRQWDKIFPLTEGAASILSKRIEQYKLALESDTYRRNNPYGFIFVDSSGLLPEMKSVEKLRYIVPKKSGVRAVTSRRLIRHFRSVHQADFHPVA